MDFEALFISEGRPYNGNSKRDKFLSRIFGIFNEEIIRIWCENEKSPFTNIGRPTIYDDNGKHYTLDFLLKDNENRLFVTEMKCEIEYQKYQFLTLKEAKQFKHHRSKRAFELFLDLSKNPKKYDVKCGGNKKNIDGTALVWGRISTAGEVEIKQEFDIEHVISTERVVADLIGWKDEGFRNIMNLYKSWAVQLFDGLQGDYV